MPSLRQRGIGVMQRQRLDLYKVLVEAIGMTKPDTSLVCRLRMRLTRLLLRVAIKTCVMGFCQDHLEEALRFEQDNGGFGV